MDGEAAKAIGVIACVGIILCVAAVVFGQVARQAFTKDARKGSPKSLGMLLVRSQFLRLATVIAVIAAVVLLGVVEKLTEGAVALLSGVAGFVLGGAARTSADIDTAAGPGGSAAKGRPAEPGAAPDPALKAGPGH